MPIGLSAGPFRGLAAYEESDASLLFGRDEERDRLVQMVGAAETDGPILVTGEAGVGKTSLLRAGLLPLVGQARRVPIYLDCAQDWQRQLLGALTQLLGRPPSPDEDPLAVLARQVEQSGARPLLVIDHVEQVAWIQDERQEQMRRLIAHLRSIPQALFVFATDRGYPYALAQLARGLEAIPEDRTVDVERFDQAAAAQIMERMVLAGGGYMEAGLPETVTGELCASGPVMPAALQAVGHAAALNGATSLKGFNRVGGAEVLSTSYVELLAGRAGGWRARRALTLFAEQPNPRAVVSLGEVAQSSGLPIPAAAVVLSALQREGLVDRHQSVSPEATLTAANADDTRAGETYSLLHPYLHQSVRDYCAPVQRGRARARLALRRRRQGGQLLRPHELLGIWRYLGASQSDLERQKTQRGVQVWGGVLAGLLALPLAVVLVLYLLNAGSSYLHTASALASVQRVVVRAGEPSLSFAFPLSHRFGKVVVDSGIAAASVPAELSSQISTRLLSGDLLDGDGAVPPWLDKLLAPLAPVRRGAWLTLAGHPGGAKVLLAAAGDRQHRRKATESLALLSGDSPETRQALLQCVADSRPAVRRMAVSEARRLGSGGLKVLRQAAGDNDAQVRLAALKALVKLDPDTALSMLPQRLRDVDTRVQTEALAQLMAAGKDRPVRAFAIVHRATAGGRAALAPIADQLDRLRGQLLREQADRIADYLTEQLDSDKQPKRQVEMLRWLISIADRLKANRILPIVNRLASDRHVQVRATAIGLQARFGEGEEVMDKLKKLSRSYARGTGAAMRRAAAVGLGLVKGQRTDRVKVLKRLLTDPAESVRGAAVVALLRLGGAALTDVVKAIRAGRHADVAHAALRAVCSGEIEVNRRLATIVLASAWKTKRTTLRAQALRCAKSLAAANARLGRWLADQAAVDKDPVVRQAAAEAVALALSTSGAKLARLSRFYLRDRDATTRAAVARAIARRPPPKPRFLFGSVRRLTRDTDPTVRAASAKLVVLSAPKPAQAVELINELLQDKQPRVLRAALAASRLLKPSDATRKLGRTLSLVVARTKAPESLAALQAARQLGLTAPLQQAAVHPEERVRAAAIEALARTGDRKRSLKVLESALREDAVSLRLAALRALAEQSQRLGEPAVQLLWRSTRAKGLIERRAAFAALGEVRGEAVGTAAKLLLTAARHRSEERRRMAMRALGALTPHDANAAAALVAGAVDPALDVRTEAQAALSAHLARVCEPERLWQLLRGSERNAIVRRTMIIALATHGRRDGAAWLRQAVKKLPASTSVVTRSAARLALALATRSESPERVVSWLYGW